MKRIKYAFLSAEINIGTDESPIIEPVYLHKNIPYNDVNLVIAKKEAYNGEYTIEDDGIEETVQPTDSERIAELENMMNALLGVSE